MTTANKLTLLRMALIPVFLGVLYAGVPGHWALGIFIVASLTDMLDGYIARHYNQITNFGKFMDPLADKVLVLSAMCWFVEAGRMPGWVLATVLLREFAVSGMRLVAVEQGRVIAAGWSGKVKTAATMVCLCLMLFIEPPGIMPYGSAPALADTVDLVSNIVIVATTLYSGAEYFIKNRDVFKNSD
jgi:CDP-diacylglycerol--glycerol-3-phosphate 3-phosphatidyltransferase